MQTQTKPETTIERLLKESGLKPGWVIEKSGIRYSRLRDLRRGTAEPRASEIAALSSVFKVPPDTFIPAIN